VVLFGLVGMEMSAVHAEEVKNPRRDYPRALFWSTLIILGSLMFSSLAIAIVIPANEISLVAGVIDAFRLFFATFHLEWLTPIIAICIIIGGISGVSAWIIGPTKGLLAAANDGCLPDWLKKTNRHGAPVAVLLLQGGIFSVLCGAFLLFPTVNSSYWFFSALTAQLAMLVYVLMFTASIRLRYSHPEQYRAYIIPGKRVGIWLAASAGILISIFAIAIGFLPPPNIKIGNVFLYEGLLVTGILVFTGLPFVLFRKSSL
jgi:Amino acid transporters